MDRCNFLGLLYSTLLLLTALPVHAIMYKWYDEAGKVNYSQTPPPPGSRPAAINADTFSTVNMYKAPPIKFTSTSKRHGNARLVIKKRTRCTSRSSCP
jgi:hypothetical protein